MRLSNEGISLRKAEISSKKKTLPCDPCTSSCLVGEVGETERPTYSVVKWQGKATLYGGDPMATTTKNPCSLQRGEGAQTQNNCEKLVQKAQSENPSTSLLTHATRKK